MRTALIAALARTDSGTLRAELVLVPDTALASSLLADAPRPPHLIACLPGDSPLAAGHPDDFERIDAARCWAGLLVMRGAPVQNLADFPADADPVSVLLRLALQAGTPCIDLTTPQLSAETWLLADSAAMLAAHEQGLIARAGGGADWRAPLSALAGVLVRRLAPRGLVQGMPIAAGIALTLLIAASVNAAFGAAAAGLALAAAGAFAGAASAAYASLIGQLRREPGAARLAALLSRAVDGLAAAALLLVLAPPQLWAASWAPLAICGPLAIGLARLAARGSSAAAAAIWADRASQLAGLALATTLGVLPQATALFAAAGLGALLLRRAED